MTYSIASKSLGGGVCFQACLLVCKGLGPTDLIDRAIGLFQKQLALIIAAKGGHTEQHFD